MTTGRVVGDDEGSFPRHDGAAGGAPDAHAAADADADAAGALVRRLRGRVQKIAASLLCHAADAEDAAQVSLLEIVKAAPSFRGEGSPEAWADRIAVRTSMRFARRRRLVTVKNDVSVEPDDLHAPPAEDRSDELPRSIRSYLDQLPEARRTVLVLRHAMGYSVDEIAELTGVSVNTVKDRLLQSREQVRRMVRRELAVGPPSGGMRERGRS